MFDAARVRDLLDYDPETGVMRWVNVSKYHIGLNSKEAGGPVPNHNGKRYVTITIDGRKYKRSRLAFAWMTGRWPTHCIDHINGNSEDDRWVNLREATITENAWNHSRRAKRSALPMGVRTMASGRYQARLAVNKKMLHLGTFATPEEAVSAYQKAREEHYGQFA